MAAFGQRMRLEALRLIGGNFVCVVQGAYQACIPPISCLEYSHLGPLRTFVRPTDGMLCTCFTHGVGIGR
jgi:hypothetical protein